MQPSCPQVSVTSTGDDTVARLRVASNAHAILPAGRSASGVAAACGTSKPGASIGWSLGRSRNTMIAASIATAPTLAAHTPSRGLPLV